MGLAVATGVALVAGCAGADPNEAITTGEADRHVVTVAAAPAAPDVVAATDALGRSLLALGGAEENVVVSPASLVVALSMLAEGARGESARALDEVLGASGSQRTDAVNALLAALEEYDGDPAVVQEDELPDVPVVHVANQVVVDDQLDVRPEFLDALAAGYGAGVLETDLGGGEAKDLLDAWVSEHTGGLIEQSAISPNDDLRLVLQNAVLLAARWDTPFPEWATRPGPFTTAGGEQVETDQMRHQSYWAHAEVDGWQAVRLPYAEGFHSDVLLPPVGTDPADLPETTAAEVRAALDAADPVEVALTMPSLDVDADTLDLLPALDAMGLGTLLSPATADLPGIGEDTGGQPLYLGQAFQQARLVVDEEGTVAAAVTELGVMAGSAQVARPVELVVDRPYLFTVSHTETGWSLFAAAIRDPRH